MLMKWWRLLAMLVPPGFPSFHLAAPNVQWLIAMGGKLIKAKKGAIQQSLASRCCLRALFADFIEHVNNS